MHNTGPQTYEVELVQLAPGVNAEAFVNTADHGELAAYAPSLANTIRAEHVLGADYFHYGDVRLNRTKVLSLPFRSTADTATSSAAAAPVCRGTI